MINSVAINAAASGDNTLVAAAANKHVRVVSFAVVAGGTVSVTFKSGSTALTGAMPFVANGGVAAQPMPLLPGGLQGHFETNHNEALVLNLSGAVQVSGWLTYILAN